MCNCDVVDHSTRVCSSKHKANLSDYTMENISTSLNQLISIDGQCCDVLMLNILLSCTAFFGIIKCTVTVYTIITILKEHMTKNITDLAMDMLPNQRDSHTITIFKCVLSNGSTIATLKIVFSNITTKIVVHRYYLLYYFFLFRVL